jgi:hypothetical protein
MMIDIIVAKVFRDSKTSSTFRDVLFEDEGIIDDDQIHLDGIAAGWGCCCLQVTFQAQSFAESLHLYDQLLPLTGIMVRILLSLLLLMRMHIYFSWH